MKNLDNKVAVITGAGSGMGKELAIQLAAKGAQVALNDWHEQNLLETLDLVKKKGGKGIAKRFDVSNRKAVYAFAEEIINTFGQVDIVINNAGIALPATNIEDTTYEDFEKLIGINMWGVIYGSKAFLPHLQQRPEAALVNTSSVFGIMGYPTQGPYCTAKFAVKGFNEALRLELELEDSKVVVTSVHPGGIKTSIVTNIEYKPGTVSEEEKKEFVKNFDEMAPTTAEDAAAQIIKAIQKKKTRLLIGSDARFIDRMVRLLPTRYARFILKKYQATQKIIDNAEKKREAIV